MIVTVHSERMKHAMGIASKVIKQNGARPILQHIKFEVNDGLLKMTATDLMTMVEMYVPTATKASVDGAFTLPAKTFSALVANLPLDRMQITAVSSSKVTVSCGNFVSEINTLPADDYPDALETAKDAEPSITMDGASFARLGESVSIAAAFDNSRPVLRAVAIAPTHAVSADGFRLAIYHHAFAVQKTMLIPAETIKFAMSVIQPDNAVSIRFTDHHAVIETEHITIRSVLIDGNYPDVTRVIPQRSEHDAIYVKRTDLVQAIKIARIFAKLNGNIVRLSFSENELVLEANGKDVGNNHAVLECRAAKAGKIAVNINYLADAISTIDDEVITMYITTEHAPLTLCTNPTYQHIVMPMAVK